MYRVGLVVILLLMLGSTLVAQVPTTVNYQGRLTNASGQAVPDGNYAVTFTIYDMAVGGTAWWTETQMVTASGGLFGVALGMYTPLVGLPQHFGGERWLGVKVGSDPEQSPRYKFTAVPYAMVADFAPSYLRTSGGTVSGPITGIGGPAITMGKGNFGSSNTNSGNWSFVAGENNAASGDHATVAGGLSNLASGPYSAVVGCSDNQADGWRSFACGFAAKANNNNCFIFGDGTATSYYSDRNDQAKFRVSGGFKMDVNNGRWVEFYDNGSSRLINTSTNAYLSTGGTWTNASSRSLKTGFASISGQWILDRLATLPVMEWYYKTEGPAVKHVGPTAEDFSAAFGLGGDTTSISTVDPSGVALVAIKELIKQNAALKAQLDALTAAVAQLKPKK